MWEFIVRAFFALVRCCRRANQEPDDTAPPELAEANHHFINNTDSPGSIFIINTPPMHRFSPHREFPAQREHRDAISSTDSPPRLTP